MQVPNFSVGDYVKYDTGRGLIYRMRITHIEPRANGSGPCFCYSGEIECFFRNKKTGKLEVLSNPTGHSFNIEECMLSAIDIDAK